jgi:uncharacterized protein
MDVFDEIIKDVYIFFDTNIKFEKNHTFDHAMTVLHHLNKSIEYSLEEEYKDPWRVLHLKCAALLHDVDDKKFFPFHKNYENAREILSKYNYTIDIDLVIKIISYVSFSENGISSSLSDDDEPSDKDDDKWMFIVRDCDRLESIGIPGILRAYSYSLFTNRELYLPNTPLPQTRDEIHSIMSKNRYIDYLKTKNSMSMMDHFFDKVLYVCDDLVNSSNTYILKEAIIRSNNTYSFVLNFSKNPLNLKNEILKLQLL